MSKEELTMDEELFSFLNDDDEEFTPVINISEAYYTKSYQARKNPPPQKKDKWISPEQQQQNRKNYQEKVNNNTKSSHGLSNN